YPNGTMQNQPCVYYSLETGGFMADVNCSAPVLHSAVCQKDMRQHRYSWSYSFVLAPSDYDAYSPHTNQPFQYVAQSGTQLMYGMTLQSYGDCRPYDRFQPTLNEGRIVIVKNDDCLMLASGAMTVDAWVLWMVNVNWVDIMAQGRY